MTTLNTEEKEYKIKYLKDLEMTKSDRMKRMDYTDKDIQVELDFLASNLICDKEMKIKIGAQIMCIVNIQSDTGIEVCNGSQGIVTAFCEFTGCPRVKFNNGIERIMTRNVWESDKIPGIGVSQVPIILAWALTIHKSQGATMDAAEIDVGSGIFECGQTYVALSRVKSLDGLYLTSFDANKIRINKKVKVFYEELTKYQSEINTVIVPPTESVKNDDTVTNPFDKFKFDELTEEKYDENNNNIKIIKLLG